MGLMYPFPIDHDESDFVFIDEQNSNVTIKSYGLPYIFWLYGLAAMTVYGFMMLGVWGTLITLLKSGDSINQALAICFLAFCGSLPIALFGFFFYQKTVEANHKENKLIIFHKVAGLTLKKRSVQYEDKIQLEVTHFLDSPNMARMHGDEQMRGFKNKGYFLLQAKALDSKKVVLIDRSSNKADLGKIKSLLEQNHLQ